MSRRVDLLIVGAGPAGMSAAVLAGRQGLRVRVVDEQSSRGPDLAQPVICASPNAKGAFHAFGFSGHGFQLVPVVGAIMADLIVHGGTRRSIEGFDAKRLMQRQAAA